MSHVVFETERLLLREFETRDAEDLFRLNSNPEVLKYVFAPKPWTLEDAEQFIAGYDLYDRYGMGRWAVIEKSTGKLTGWCGLKFRTEIAVVDLGYRFFPEYWGNGFATEAAKASVQYGFEKLGLPKIYASYFPDNIASGRVMEKTGMQPSSLRGIRDELLFCEIANSPGQTFDFSAVIETERLELRKMLPTDARTMFALNDDPDVLRYTGDKAFDSPEAAYRFLVDYQQVYVQYGFARWTVILKETRETLGWCGLRKYEENDPVDLGYRFFRRHWNKGFATEASLACLRYGFETLGFDRIMARAAIENRGSTRVMEKCGMKYYDRRSDERACGDTVYYELYRSGFSK